MKTLTIAAAVLALGAAQAQAQAVSSEQIDPVRLRLARELMEARGGEQAAREQIIGLYASIGRMMVSWSPTAGKAAMVFQDTVRDGLLEALPQIMETSTKVYARNLSVQELTDYISWTKSDSGQAILQKAPAINRQAIEGEAPLLKSLMPKIMHKAVVQACDEKASCTPEVRAKMTAAVDQALKAYGS